MRLALKNSILFKIGIYGDPTIHTDHAVRVACNIDNPITNIITADTPCQGDPTGGGSYADCISVDFRISAVLAPNRAGNPTVRRGL